MFLYIAFSLCVVVVHYTLARGNVKIPKIKNTPLFVSTVLLGLFLGLRGESVGTDTLSYEHIYNTYFSMDWAAALSQTKYVGWSIYAFVLTKLGFNYHSYLLLTSLLMSLLLYKIVCFFLDDRKTNFAILLFLFMYTYFNMFNAFRSYFALLILLYGVTKLLQNKKIPYILLTLLAISVHSTMLVGFAFLPFYLISKKRYSNERLALGCWLIVFSVSLCLINPLIGLFVKIFPAYGMYLSTMGDSLSTTNRGRTIILRVVELVIGFYFFVTCLNAKSSTKEKFLLFSFLFANIMGAIFYNKTLMLRLASIFLFMDFIAIAYLTEHHFIKGEKFRLKVSIAMVFFVLLTVMLYGNYGDIIPYVFWK